MSERTEVRGEWMIDGCKHFRWNEAKCRCGRGDCELPVIEVQRTANKLERLRSLAGGPIPVNSWYRCPHHPTELFKRAGSLHRHTTGRAVDLPADGGRRLKLIELARAAGFRSVGVYSWGVHLDWVDGDVCRHWIGRV